MDSYEPSPIEPRNNRANIVLKKRTFGGVPPGAGMREDVALLFEEIEETRNTIAQVQAIMQEVPEPKIQVGKYNKNENLYIQKVSRGLIHDHTTTMYVYTEDVKRSDT